MPKRFEPAARAELTRDASDANLVQGRQPDPYVRGKRAGMAEGRRQQRQRDVAILRAIADDATDTEARISWGNFAALAITRIEGGEGDG